MPQLSRTALRTRFAETLSALYATEVPAYRTLLDVTREVNQRALAAHGSAAERLGTVERVSAERHGAIRVGTPTELQQVARIFGALGMEPVGFYDLRGAHPRPIPVVATAFRPVDPAELAVNPFRVFTSLLVPEDRRFFDADLERRLRAFLADRTLFPAELLDLADRAQAEDGLDTRAGERFLALATASFALSSSPVDEAWYRELESVSSVAADIGGIASTHINHLTPRVLDIDDLYASMSARGITMIDRIQGPPRWSGPDVLLRQTSFRALAERRVFRGPDGSLHPAELRVRFGEVESRGIALTPRGRDRFDELVERVDRESAGEPDAVRAGAAAAAWDATMPHTEAGLERAGLAWFTYHPAGARPAGPAPETLRELVDQHWVEPRPIVYEDFLPRSAAGIFASNLAGTGQVDGSRDGCALRDIDWLSGVVGSRVHDPDDLYAAICATSRAELGRTFDRALG